MRTLLNMLHLLLTRAPNHARQIDNRQRKRKIDTRKHNSEEDIPAQQTRDESEGASRFLALCGRGGVPLGCVQEGASEQSESRDQSEED